MATRRELRVERRRKVWMSIFLSALMVFSIAGVYIGSTTTGGQQFTYNGFEFAFDQQSGGSLITEVDGATYRFYTYPDVAQRFSVPEGFIENLRRVDAAAITFTPDALNAQYLDLVRFDLASTLPRSAVGVVEPSPAYDLPRITCANATLAGPIILLNVSPQTSFSGSDRCLVLNANMTGFIELRDSLLYRYLGVIDDGQP